MRHDSFRTKSNPDGFPVWSCHSGEPIHNSKPDAASGHIRFRQKGTHIQNRANGVLFVLASFLRQAGKDFFHVRKSRPSILACRIRQSLHVTGGRTVNRIAVISAILENPASSQQAFNDLVSAYHDIVRGRMGIPFDEHQMAVISLTLVGPVDRINSLTGQLGSIPGVQVKAAISRKSI
jgi:putative iron-only hydrogenase system regulator